MESLKKKAFRGFAWDYMGSYVNQAITFIISIFLARILSPEDFGLLGVSMVFISLAQIFLDMGFGSAIIQKDHVSETQLSTVFFLNTGIGFFLFFLFFFSAPFIGEFYDDKTIGHLIKVLSTLFIINGLAGVPSSLLRKYLQFKELTIRNIISSIAGGVAGIGLALAGLGVWALVAKAIVSSIINLVLVWAFSRYRLKMSASMKSVKDLWRYGNKLFLSSVINVIYERADIMIIGKLFSPVMLGYYNRAKSFNLMIVNYSSSSVGNVLFPSISQIKDDRDRVARIVKKSLQTVSFIVFGFIGLFWITGNDLIIFLFSDKWETSTGLFKLMLLTGYSYPVGAILVKTIAALGNSGAFLRLEIIKKIVATLAFPIGFYFGLKGFLIAIAIAGFISTILNMLFVSKDLRNYSVKNQVIDVFMYLPVSVISIFLTIPVHNSLPELLMLRLLADTLVFTMIYLFINYFLNFKGFMYTRDILVEYIPLLIRKLKSNL
jgi:teichuronic acid exporter